MSLTRTQISLSAEDRRVLAIAGRRTGRSMSALIREAIHSTYGTPSSADRVSAALDLSFGATAVAVEGEALVESIRSGRRLTDPT